MREASSMELLIGTRDGLRTATGELLGLGGRTVNTMAGRADDAWVVVDGREVWRLEHGNLTLVTQGCRRPSLTCAVYTRTSVLFGTHEAHLRRLDGSTLVPVDGFDRAEGREAWFTPWGGPPTTRSMAVGERDTVYATVHVGGVLWSTDDAATWQPTALDIRADAHQVIAPAGHESLLLAATARGLAISRNAGESWEMDARGLDAAYARAVALSESMILLSVSRGPGGERAALYRRSLDGREPFVRCVEGLPRHFDDNIDTDMLVADGPTVTMAGPDGALYRSTDSGRTWQVTVTGLPEVCALLI